MICVTNYKEFRQIVEEKFDAYVVLKALLDEKDVTVGKSHRHRDYKWFSMDLDDNSHLEFFHHYKDLNERVEFFYHFKQPCPISESLRSYHKLTAKAKSGDFISPMDMGKESTGKQTGTYYFDTEDEFYTFVDKYIINAIHGTLDEEL
jgi:hypothetical protein